MYKVLLIDDDKDFKETFSMDAQRFSIQTIYRNSLAGLQEVMPQHHNTIAAVVLDIKCLLTSDQPIENENFIGTAIKFLDTSYPNFPRIILTGDDDAFNNFKRFSGSEDVYLKTPQGLKDAIAKLNHFCKNSTSIKIIIDNPNVFNILKNPSYGAQTETTLINILKIQDETDITKFGGILRDIRSIQEVIYKAINQNNKTVVPDTYFKPNGMIEFNGLMRHLSGNPAGQTPTTTQYQNSAVRNLADSLYWTCGKYIHADPKETYHISNYTIRAMTNSLLEIVLWSKPHVT
ncbi:hypothetical protein ACYZTM_09950 [Pseudomonas sp. MDT2-39-1]